jgi:uncharacterized protein
MRISPAAAPDEFEVIRDPLWNTIRLDRDAVRIIDTPAFQRLRHVRQLGLAYLVYPGATHTRFDHALGVFHLTRRALGLLQERGELAGVDPVECRMVPYAALLHDIGHYPFSHALEELDAERVPEHHEALTARFLREGELHEVLEGIAPGGAGLVERLIRGASGSPLQGLVAGSLDLDKIEYLNRDATFCGVPYGAVDVDRLLHAITLVADPATGRREVGIHEKGLSALESLLFAKYQMFRNVYWHHAVRSATALYKRLVQEAVDAGAIRPADLVGRSDEGLLGLIEGRAQALGNPGAERVLRSWLPGPPRAAPAEASAGDTGRGAEGGPAGGVVLHRRPPADAARERPGGGTRAAARERIHRLPDEAADDGPGHPGPLSRRGDAAPHRERSRGVHRPATGIGRTLPHGARASRVHHRPQADRRERIPGPSFASLR